MTFKITMFTTTTVILKFVVCYIAVEVLNLGATLQVVIAMLSAVLMFILMLIFEEKHGK